MNKENKIESIHQLSSVHERNIRIHFSSNSANAAPVCRPDASQGAGKAAERDSMENEDGRQPNSGER